MSTQSSKKVLVLALSGIGNLLMQFPVINALKKAHPDWQITVWVAPRGTRELAEHNPNIDEVIEMPIKNSFFGHLRTIRSLITNHYSLAIMLSPGQLIKGALYMFAAGIPTRIGHRYPFFGRNSSLFLTDAIDEQPKLHDIEQNLNLLKLLDIRYPISDIKYQITIPLSNQRDAEDLMRELSIPTTRRLLGLHPGSAPGFEFKRWPLENFAELAKHFISKNYHVLVFGGPDEKDLKQQLKEKIGSDTTIVSHPSLLTTAALMQKCELFTSNDSGLMHLAAAAGVKTYGLFGPTDEALTGPRGQNSYAIRASNTHPIYETENKTAREKMSAESLHSLVPDMVINEIQKQITA